MHCVAADELEIVQHQCDFSAWGGPGHIHIVDKGGQDGFGRSLRSSQRSSFTPDHMVRLVGLLEGDDQIGQKASRLVIARIERQPGDTHSTGGDS
jgi:hypothetical protein